VVVFWIVVLLIFIWLIKGLGKCLNFWGYQDIMEKIQESLCSIEASLK